MVVVVTIMIRIRTKEEEQTSRPNHNMSFPNQALSLSLLGNLNFMEVGLSHTRLALSGSDPVDIVKAQNSFEYTLREMPTLLFLTTRDNKIYVSPRPNKNNNNNNNNNFFHTYVLNILG